MSIMYEGSQQALGTRIRKHRDIRGWSQQDLAAWLDMDTVLLEAIERGDADPTLGLLERFVGCFDMPVGDLLADIDRL